jgi:hypothetical protein
MFSLLARSRCVFLAIAKAVLIRFPIRSLSVSMPQFKYIFRQAQTPSRKANTK